MKILTLPNPILHQVCQPVKVGDKQVKKLAKQMSKLMYKSDGVGIAAPQVGILQRFVVIDCQYCMEDENGNSPKKNPLVLINPEIIEHSEEKIKNIEGCLSVPGISVEVERWSSVVVKCLNENFEEVIYEGGADLFGRCLQHELDHLDGNTMIERLNPVMRIKAMQEYEQALARGARPGEV
jgi:peptide deformylase